MMRQSSFTRNRETAEADMKRLKVLIIVGVFILGLGIGTYNKADRNVMPQFNWYQGAQLIMEQQLKIQDEATIEKIPNSRLYELFYGEWEISETIYAEPMPIRGIYYEEDELLNLQGKYFNEEEIRKIKLTPDYIQVNDEAVQKAQYRYLIFPADDLYRLHFTITLKDLGLTEENGNYYVYVEVENEENESFSFFIKDADTIIVSHDDYFIEYKKESDIGNGALVIIAG